MCDSYIQVFCQNHDIAHQRNGFDLTPEQLAEWYMKLQDVGKCHNINLVTPEHFVPQVALSILHAASWDCAYPLSTTRHLLTPWRVGSY